jgi:hypothetical protein
MRWLSGSPAGRPESATKSSLGSDTALVELVEKCRTEAGRLEVADHNALRRHLLDLEVEELLERDRLRLHPLHLHDRGDAAGAVFEPLEVDDHVERSRDLLPNRAHRQVIAGHHDHGLDPGERVTRSVGVNRRERAVVTRVHSLEHVQRLRSTDLTDDDPLRPHAQ